MTIPAPPIDRRRHDRQRGPDVHTAQRAHATHQHLPVAGRDADLGILTWPLAAAPAPTSTSFPCQESPADLWFAEAPEEVEAAKALCLECPIREACLAGALERREPWGVWGGQLVLQGVVVPRKRPRGRPRKDAGQAA